jgi:hypothetical protein
MKKPRRNSGRWGLLAGFLAVACPAATFEGTPPVRKGFWWSFGAGYGSAYMECDQCLARGREGSFSGWFRLGGTIRGKLLLGWELNGWLKNDKGNVQTALDVTRTLGNSALIAVYYPVSSSGVFAKVGAGLSYVGLPPRDQATCLTQPILVSLECIASQDKGAHGNGLGITMGVGYDFRIRPNISITPELSYTFGKPGDLRDGTTVVTGGSRTRWHWVWA